MGAEKKSSAALRKCDGYEPDKLRVCIDEIFGLLGGCQRFVSRGDRVLLKPNFIIPSPAGQCAQTHPEFIVAVAKYLKDKGARPFVGDSPAWNSVQACVDALGLAEPLGKLGVEIVEFKKSRKIDLADTKVKISFDAMEADTIINLPKLKAHQQLGATIAVKNMFGCVCGKQKAYFHFTKGDDYQAFCQMLIEIYKFLSPGLTIVDGVMAMEGQGPIHGKPRRTNFIAAAADPIACERLCCKMMNMEAGDLPIVQTAEKMGFGVECFEDIEILGDNWRELVCEDFAPAMATPLKFTLGRVIKSISKQIVMLVKRKS